MKIKITSNLVKHFKGMVKMVDTKTCSTIPKGFLVSKNSFSVYNSHVSATYSSGDEELGLLKEVDETNFILPIKAVQLIISLPINTDIEITKKKEKIIIKAKNPKTRSQFATEPPHSFPEMPSIERTGEMSIEGSTFSELIKTSLLGADENDRNILKSSVRLISENKRLDVVATDGYTLIWQCMPYDSNFQMNISAKVLKSLLPFINKDEKIKIGITDKKRHSSFSTDNFILFGRLLDISIIEYENICAEKENKVIVNKNQLCSVLERALLSQEKGTNTQLAISDGMLNVAITSSTNEYQEALPITGKNIKEHSCTINGRFMIDTLKAFNTKDDDEILLQYDDSPLKPLLLVTKEKDLYGIVLPMRTK